MKPELFREIIKIIFALIVGAGAGGTVFNINLKFQVGQLEQAVEVLAPENPLVKGKE